MTSKNNNPWAGLASYEDPAKSERKLKFCGRDNDIYDVTRLIDDNLLLVLYGKSGIGKTSLLNAGVFPKLRLEQYLPISIRLGILEANASYQEAVISTIENAIKEVQGSITVFNVVEEQTDNQLPDRLWNYFAKHRFANAEGRPLFPVIVLDQFEEVLRNASPEHVGKARILLNQLQYLIDESHALNDCVVDGQEYFYDFNFRFVISIREDELYLLEDNIDDLSLSTFRNCRYRLRSLSEQGATEAILSPGKDCIAEEQKQAVVDRIIELSKRPQSNDIDTLLLSLVCSGTYDKIAGEKITLSDLAVWKSNPMEVYYQDAVKGLTADQVRYIQRHLIREDGSRRRMDAEEVKAALGEATYRQLTLGANRLLTFADKGQVELLHDQLGMAVYEERKAFEERERKKRLRRRVTAISLIILAIAGVFFFQNHRLKQQRWKMMENQSKLVAEKAIALAPEDSYLARRLALEILPKDLRKPDRPYTAEAERALREANLYHSAVINMQYVVPKAILSPDGKEIMTSSYIDSTFRFYDKNTGKLIRSYKTNCFCKDYCYSSDGKQILSYNNSTLIILDAQEGTIVKTILVDTSRIYSAKYDFSGKRIITTSGHTIKIWDEKTGTIIKTIESENYLFDAQYSPKGNLIAAIEKPENKRWSWEVENSIIVFDAESYKVELRKDGCENVYSLVFSPDEKKILISSLGVNSSISILDIKSGSSLLKISTDNCQNVSFSPSGDRIIASSDYRISTDSDNNPKTIKIWDSNSGEELQTLHGHKNFIQSVMYGPDGNEVVSASTDGTIRLWNLNSKDNSIVLVNKNGQIHSPQIAPTSGLISYSSPVDSTIKVWDAQGKEIVRLKTEDSFCHVAINPDGKEIAYSTDNVFNPSKLDGCDSIVFYNLEKGEISKSLIDTAGAFGQITFSPDGNKLAITTCPAYTIKLLDLETDSVIWTFSKRNEISNMNFSPDGNKLCLTSFSSTPLCVVDVATGEKILELATTEANQIWVSSYSPDGKTIAFVSPIENIVTLCDAETLSCIKTLEGHENGVLCVCFSPDGKYLATGSKDKTIRIWELQSGVCVCTLNGHKQSVDMISFTLDGKSIVSVSNFDCTIRKWPFPPLQDLIDQTRERFKDRPLTPEERRMYYLE